jgi:hypothetical protein
MMNAGCIFFLCVVCIGMCTLLIIAMEITK